MMRLQRRAIEQELDTDRFALRSLRMSIPRLAIHRPVTMFMISFVVVLLGGYDKGRRPSKREQQSQIARARRRLADHLRRNSP